MTIQLMDFWANHGSIVQFRGIDLDTDDVVIVSCDRRPAIDIALALEAGEDEVLVDPEPYLVSTLHKAGKK